MCPRNTLLVAGNSESQAKTGAASTWHCPGVMEQVSNSLPLFSGTVRRRGLGNQLPLPDYGMQFLESFLNILGQGAVIIFSLQRNAFYFGRRKKSADCHLKVSVQNQCSVIGFGNNSLSTVSLVLFASEKLLLFVVVVIFCFLFHIFSLCSPGWPQTCELPPQDPSCWH